MPKRIDEIMVNFPKVFTKKVHLMSDKKFKKKMEAISNIYEALKVDKCQNENESMK